MASHAQVFLLLMVSQLLLSVTVVSAPSKDEILQKMKSAVEVFIKHLDETRQAATPILEIIEESKTASAIVNAISLVITGSTKDDPVLNKVIDEFQNLNIKLDKYHVKQRWDSWASGTYSKPEMDIEVAWSDFSILLESLIVAKDKEAIERHKEEFLTSYQKYEPATENLRRLLTAKEPTFISNLGLMLADYVNCHKTDIKQYSAFIQSLIFRGNLLNKFYYILKNINSPARIQRLTDIQYDTATAMFQVQKHCISEITEYVERDVTALIDTNEKHKDLADKIRAHLEKSDKKYDWIVVVFKTKRSNFPFLGKYRNKHTLHGFSVVTKEGVSVGVARQTPGTYSMAEKVKEAIQKCLTTETPWCSEVEGILRKCGETVDNIPMLETYTAVHAFHGNSHESSNSESSDISTDEKGEYDLSFNTNHPNIYEGKCKIVTFLSKNFFKGQFHVMIKSDEEIKNNVCKTLTCGNEAQGKCEAVGSPPIPLCECKKPYYGKNCEKKS